MDKLDETWDGLPGLWGSVCLGILADLRRPTGDSVRGRAEAMLEHPGNTCLPVVAVALGIDTEQLIRKIKAVRANV
jgi:hypothetical protein